MKTSRTVDVAVDVAVAVAVSGCPWTLADRRAPPVNDLTFLKHTTDLHTHNKNNIYTSIHL